MGFGGVPRRFDQKVEGNLAGFNLSFVAQTPEEKANHANVLRNFLNSGEGTTQTRTQAQSLLANWEATDPNIAAQVGAGSFPTVQRAGLALPLVTIAAVGAAVYFLFIRK